MLLPGYTLPRKWNFPGTEGAGAKVPDMGSGQGKMSPLMSRSQSGDMRWLPSTAGGRHKRWWEPKLPCGSQTPLLDGDGMLAGNKLNSGRELGTTSYLLFKTLAWHHLTGVSNAFQNNRGLELYPNFRNKLFLPSLLNTITVFSKPWNPVSFSRQKSQDLCTSIL